MRARTVSLLLTAILPISRTAPDTEKCLICIYEMTGRVAGEPRVCYLNVCLASDILFLSHSLVLASSTVRQDTDPRCDTSLNV